MSSTTTTATCLHCTKALTWDQDTFGWRHSGSGAHKCADGHNVAAVEPGSIVLQTRVDAGNEPGA